MKKYMIFFLAAFSCLLFSWNSAAENGLRSDSVDPVSDSVFLSQIRAHLDAVRAERKRPIVGLVLCGGGAKGAAEIGALHVIDSLEIPIDFVCGTSIGSLLGGMMSVGYDVDFMDSLVSGMDWTKMLSDKIDPSVIPLKTKMLKSQYALSIPFHYAKDRGEKRVLRQNKYTDSDGRITIDEVKSRFATPMEKNSLASSLPAGYVYGHNVNNLFSSLTVGYQDSVSFADLPIPFACVTTEIVTCKAKHFGSGQLKSAMRASMGIPGFFTPIRRDGMVLVDGGSRNNFPTDIAKAVGCDYIIGIDISDMDTRYDDVNNVGTVLSQLINMLVRTNLEQLRETADVYIRPDVTGYSSMSFSAEAMDTLKVRGRVAAMAALDALKAVKAATGSDRTVYQARKAVNIHNHPVMLRSISFDGMSDPESKVLHRLIKLDIRKPVDAMMLEKAAAIVQGSGAVESVSYSLLGSEEPYDLVFNCSRSPVHRLGVALRLDTEVWAQVGLNVGFNVNRLLGPKLDINAKVGQCQGLDLHFMYGMPGVPTINAEVSIDNYHADEQPMFMSDRMKMEASFWRHEEKIYASSTAWPAFMLRGGVKNTFYRLNDNRMAAIVSGIPPVLRTTNIIGAFLDAHLYTMDNYYFPKKGVDFYASGNCDFFKAGVKKMDPKYAVKADIRFVIPMGSRVALIPDIHGRFAFDKAYNVFTNPYDMDSAPNMEYSFSHRNFLGGDIGGRYFDHQIPFIGFNDIMDCVDYDEHPDGSYSDLRVHDHIAVLNLDLRVNVWKELYISAMGAYAHMAPTFNRFITFNGHKDIFAAGAQVAYNTVVGPVKFRLQWADHRLAKGNWSAYMSVGFNF